MNEQPTFTELMGELEKGFVIKTSENLYLKMHKFLIEPEIVSCKIQHIHHTGQSIEVSHPYDSMMYFHNEILAVYNRRIEMSPEIFDTFIKFIKRGADCMLKGMKGYE